MELKKLITITISLVALGFVSACSEGSGGGGGYLNDLTNCIEQARIKKENGTLTTSEYDTERDRCEDVYDLRGVDVSPGGYDHTWVLQGSLSNGDSEAFDDYLKTTLRCDIGGKSYMYIQGAGLRDINDCDTFKDNIKVEIRTKNLGASSEAVVVVEGIFGTNHLPENYDYFIEDLLFYDQPYLITTLTSSYKYSIATAIYGTAEKVLAETETGFGQKGLLVTFAQDEITAENATIIVRFNGVVIGSGMAEYSKYKNRF